MGAKVKVKRALGSEEVLIADAFKQFIAEKEALGSSKDTLRNYKQSYKLFMEFNDFDEAEKLKEIDQSLFFRWATTMQQEGLSWNSVNHYLRDCRAFFYWCMAVDREYIKPAFKIEMVKGQEEPLKMFSDEDIVTLLEKPRNVDSFSTWRSWAIVNWVLATGNRAATMCAVKIGDVDFQKNEITLRHTKNKKAQVIPLDSSLATVLKEYIRIWRSKAEKDDYLFCQIGDIKLTTSAQRQAFKRYCDMREVKQSNIHGLRHNFAKLWLLNNGDLFRLQKILGHSTLDMTRRYVKLFAEDLKEDYDTFSPLSNLKKASSRTQKVQRNK